MPQHFFPTMEFGWAFFATLVGILLACSWVDLKKMVIPKWLTLPALGLGLTVNLVRGSLLGLESSTVWQLEPGGVFLGALDGLLFSLAGFAVAFALFFVFWMFGVCGGGDVKLCAAVGAWIGPGLTVRLLLLTIIVVAVYVTAQIVFAILFGTWKQLKENERVRKHGVPSSLDKPRRRLLIFSPPLALATALLLMWTFRVELQLLPPSPLPPA